MTKSLPSTRPADTSSWATPSAVSEEREREQQNRERERESESERRGYNFLITWSWNIQVTACIWKQCFGFYIILLTSSWHELESDVIQILLYISATQEEDK